MVLREPKEDKMGVQEIRDNLNIGITLAQHPHGMTLDDLLEKALGYTPGGPYPIGDREYYIVRLHQAQNVGLKNYALRVPGYFTICAQPFGNIFVYKAVWYTWVNSKTGKPCIVLICDTDLSPMRQWREKYLNTRKATTRSVNAADNVIRGKKALKRKNMEAVKRIQEEMVKDGTLSEVITGLLGVPHVDVPSMLELLSDGNPYGSVKYQFTQQAQKIRQLEDRLADEQIKIVGSLSRFVAIKQELPSNAAKLALQDAKQRLDNLH